MLGLFSKKSVPSDSWWQRLKSGLTKSRTQLGSQLSKLFGQSLNPAWFEDLEETLILADVGVSTSQWLIQKLKSQSQGITEAKDLEPLLHQILCDILQPVSVIQPASASNLWVIMFVGVNGAGKTTSIGKMAQRLQQEQRSVLLGAGDTFRAAAVAQLKTWGKRNHIPVISQDQGDSAAVLFDAVQAAKSRHIDVVLADTAGRLPTQLHLMEELKKVKRVLQKAEPNAQHDIFLVLDGNTGQNALAQVKAFHEALNLTGLIVTKLDGTAKAGVLIAIAHQFNIPIRFIGVGEALEDLLPFDADSFIQALMHD